MAKFDLLFNLLILITPLIAQDYHVLNFGAVGDGVTDDTQAVRATALAAKNSNGGRVIFDAGYKFLTGCFNITSNVILDVQGTILASTNVSNYVIIPYNPWDSARLTKQALVYSYNATNITITGGGTIDGQGPIWYKCQYNQSQPPCHPFGRPKLVHPTHTTNLLVENITLKDSPYWNLDLAWCTNVRVNNITVTSRPGDCTMIAPIGIPHRGDGLETDGVDVDCSVNVTIENSYISTCDDAVAVKSGTDWRGRMYGRASENIMVRNLTIGLSNGLAIGSGASAGARNITFQDCTLNGSYHAILIKTQLGRGGTTQDVTYKNINILNTNFSIELTMYYNPPVDNDTTLPIVKNVIITNITGNNIEQVYRINGLPESPFENIYFSNINITNYQQDIGWCGNITGVCSNSTVFPYCPPCLQQESCFDANSDCSQYLNFCNVPKYHATLCDQCRKSCNLCNSC